MINFTNADTETCTFGERQDETGRDDYFGQDLQARFGPLLLGFNEAHHDLLEADGPTSIRLTDDPGIYEIKIKGGMSTSTLTAAVIDEDGVERIDPIDFRTSPCLPFMPEFSYSHDCEDAYIKRLMTCWLEKSFLTHEAAILEGIRALPQARNAQAT